MKLFNNLPLYEAIIADENCGIYKVSCVSDPATEVNWVAFDENKPYVKFAVDNKIERMISGVIMLAETPIYRRTADGYEYYIMYSKDTLKTMAEKMIFDGVGSNVNIQHQDGTDVDGVNLVELYVINREKGIAPTYFENVPDGSLIGTYKVHNDDLWAMIENGEVLSFSLEGIFGLEETFNKQDFNNQNNKNRDKMKINKIKEMLRKLIVEVECGTIATDKGIIAWDGDEDLKEGDKVYTITEENEEQKIEDGDYTTEDGKIIVVVDSTVAEIKDAESEVAPTEEEEMPQENAEEAPTSEEEPSVEEEPSQDDKDALIEELRAKIEELEAKVAELTEENNKLKEESAAENADEAFEKIEKADSKADKMRKRGYVL